MTLLNRCLPKGQTDIFSSKGKLPYALCVGILVRGDRGNVEPPAFFDPNLKSHCRGHRHQQIGHFGGGHMDF